MNKLIYFTVGYNFLFIDLLKYCIDSLYRTGYNGDILIITDMKERILNKINFTNAVYFMEVEKSDLFKSSANKFKIYQFDKINNYDKIIFCDADVIWTKNPSILFDLINEDKIYVSNEDYSLSSHYYNYNLTDDEVELIANNKTKGFSAGFFGFNSNCISIFKTLDSLIDEVDSVPKCLEQPVFVSYLFKNDLYCNSFNPHVCHLGREFSNNNKPFDSVAMHFCGIVGSYYDKFRHMFEFYLRRLVS